MSDATRPPRDHLSPRHIAITGASSGLGAALVRAYAAPGVRLALHGRDAARLDSVAAAARASGATVDTALFDVTDAGAMADWLTRADTTFPLDLVIANAGISGNEAASGGTVSADVTRAIFAVNVDGVVNTVLPAANLMLGRGRGAIAIISSLAGYRGQPGAPAYAASKAAVKAWGEGLRPRLAKGGLHVSVVCPGFVRTPMTGRNRFPMPYLMEADRAAAIIRRGLCRNRARIAFPWQLAAVVWLLAALPASWADALLRRMPGK
ncbi:short-chain dehydrogenase [Tistrella bauzanensis]|uniref:Short-chain dehydrogenase n=1 Tax=Tistrella bauzanensis TaxID=657419 RepID=A0ABQ1IU80_9PROT|nr:SDR family NAD(P)-dependent oxidoreductase [Tistrella bauzanensis]GGB50638.1 short-chain dehydrogenase [Tistrella bauzanensis]